MANDAASARYEVSDIVQQLNAVLGELMTASRATSDPVRLLQLNSEICAAQTCLSQAVQAQIASDDATFVATTRTLKAQSTILEGMRQQISQIIADVAAAARVIGYLVSAIGLITKLP
ncbi:hypothetical protein [Burkholderia stagnalis]